MLQQLILKDFRKHQSETVDFDPHITSLVGPSNSGKTCALNAIKWIATNKPAGTSVIRRGAKAAKAALTISGQKIWRVRGKSNYYKLDNVKFKFDATHRTDVPEPILDLLALGPECFQSQHDAPFLFALSPGQVAQELNSVVDLGLIDSTLANLASDLRKAKAELEVGADRLQKAKEEKKRLSWVPLAVDAYARVADLEERAKQTAKKVSRAHDLIEWVQTATDTLGNADTIATALDRVVAAGERAVLRENELRHMNELLYKNQELAAVIEQADKEADWIETRLEKALQRRCPVCGNRPRRNESFSKKEKRQ